MRIPNIIWIAGLALLCGGTLGAQNLPNLGKADEIVTGSLPDGISYYLVGNITQPGLADFALVQPGRTDRNGPRKNLESLPHFFGRKPYGFLTDNAVGYDRRGYIEHTRDATVFRFSDVPVFRPEVTDSTLLLLFDLARSSAYEQAIVVCGNIDVPAVLERIRLLSMTISKRKEPEDAWSYNWRHQEDAAVTTSTSPIGSISAVYRSPRTEAGLMNTIQPVMSRLFAAELDEILRRRIYEAFREAGLPLVDYRYRYTGSEDTSGDEMFTISVHTSADRLEDALRIFAGVLSALDEDGATVEEVSFARTVIAEAIARDYPNYATSNAEYAGKCISSYLYGSNLAPRQTIGKVFTSRRLDASRECELLNRYVAAMLSPDRNLHLRVSAPVKPDAVRTREVFMQGWTERSIVRADIPKAEDTLRLAVPRRKVKLKSTAKDNFTGGRLWTFSNGITVVYKKTADKGVFHYGLMAKGGWVEIPEIHDAEPAFAQEVLALGKVAGMKSLYLHDLLAMYGVTMDTGFSISDVRLSGSARSSSLSLVLKTMVAVANSYEADDNAYLSYRQAKPLQLVRDKYTYDGTRAVLDSLMCPGYTFAAGSVPELPDYDFNVRIARYMYQKASNMKNCVIVLVGDLDEYIAEKLLCNTLGAFKTGQQRVVRHKLPYPLRNCWSTNTVQRNWRSTSVSVALSAMQPFGADTYDQMNLACTVLKMELDKALLKDGMYSIVDCSSEMLPAEKMAIYVHCEPVPAYGLPADATPALPVKALDTVRSVLNRLALSEIDSEELEFCKTLLTNRFKADEGNSARLRDAVLNRGSVGQDVRGSYASRIKAVKASDIRDLFSRLSDCQSEYIVQ